MTKKVQPAPQRQAIVLWAEEILFTAATLRSHTSKDLAQMAKKNGVPGWHSMRKEQLIRALLKLAKDNANKKPGRSKNGKSNVAANATPKESKIAQQIRAERIRRENLKDLALANSQQKKKSQPEKDRIVLLVRDSFWLQAYWEITREAVARARAALADSWHSAQPVLRLLETGSDTTNALENVVKEIPIHGGVSNWYIDVVDPPKSYRVALGYRASNGRFHLIAKSNEVKTPVPNNGADDNWTDITADYEKYYALSGGYDKQLRSDELQSVFEEKLRRPMNQPAFVRLGSGLSGNGQVDFPFEVDAEMIVYGATDPRADVTLGGEPVRLKDDGTFCVRMGLPDRRQVLPVVACSRDGTEQRTTVLAVERNTKVMEPISRDVQPPV